MKVAVCQVNSRHDRAANLKVALEQLDRAAGGGADLAVLPEYVDYLGPVDGEPAPEPVTGAFAETFAEAARRLHMWIVAGSFHETGPEPGRTYNTSMVFGRD
ncbi:MAG TPA: nitrilase-related carbon-nitrogen hydrolase, partial [Micromonosporaceae bacterium]